MHLLCQNILCIIFEVLFALINMCCNLFDTKGRKAIDIRCSYLSMYYIMGEYYHVSGEKSV